MFRGGARGGVGDEQEKHEEKIHNHPSCLKSIGNNRCIRMRVKVCRIVDIARKTHQRGEKATIIKEH